MGRTNTSEKNIIAQASILMAAGILVRIIGVLYRSPVTSIIGDEGNGYYGIAYNLYSMVLLISSYSIPMAVSKVVSGKLALKKYKEAHKVFRCALIYVLIVGALASLFTFFGAAILIPDSQQKAIPVLKVLAPAIFLSGFLGVLRGYFQAHSSMIPTSISQIIEQVINAIVSIGAALLFIWMFAGGNADTVPVFGAMGSAAGIVAGVAAGLVFMILIYQKNRPYFKKHYRQDITAEESSYKDIFKIIFLMVTPVILSTFVYNISATLDQTIFMDVMDYKGMVSKTAAALYGVFSTKYLTLINVPVALANSMSTAMIPAISSAYTIEDYEKCNAQVKQSIQVTMLISIPSAIGLCVLAYPVMQVLFPQKDTIDLAVNLLRIGCISVVFYCLSTVTNGVLQGIGKVNVPLRNAAVSLLIHVVVLAGLLYFTNMDLTALVFATMLYAFLMCLFNSISVKKYLGYRQELRKTFLIPFISAVGMGVLCYIFYQGLYFLLQMLFGAILPLRIVVFVCMMVSIGFAVIVYFALLIKLRGVSEAELRNFPKGYVIARCAKKFHLM